MSRTIPSDILTDLLAGSPKLFYAVELLFDSPNQLYFWTGIGSLTIGATTYLGAADVMQVGPTPEMRDGSATYQDIVFSGVNSTLINLARNEDYQYRAANLLLGTEGCTSLMTVFSGQMDKMTIKAKGDVCQIGLRIEGKMVNMTRPRPTYYTPATLQRDYATDTFFNFVSDLADRQLEIKVGG